MFKVMISLIELEKEIDALFEKETNDSLTAWLLNKRFGNISMLIGKGTFISISGSSTAIFPEKNSAYFNQTTDCTSTSIMNSLAA